MNAGPAGGIGLFRGTSVGKGGRIAELDGLRGAAALLVVVSHTFGEVQHGTRLLAFGWLGVDLFFVLSGFLIGSIVLEHHGEPGFLKRFYIKRAARILPVYAAVCAIVLALCAATAGRSWSDHPYGAGVYALFGTNFAMSFWGGGGIWLRPTWTLAVEEQFYLLLPLTIVLAPKRMLAPLLAVLWFAAVLFRAHFSESNPEAALSLLPGRMDLLLGGVLAAIANRRFDLSRHMTMLRTLPLIAMLVLVGVTFASPYRLFLILGPSISSIAIAVFLLAAVHGAPEGRRYRAPLLRYFGQISYALYLVHQPIIGLVHGLLLDGRPDIGTPAQFAATLLGIALSIAVAAASWKWFESPILRAAHANRFAVRGAAPIHSPATPLR